MIASPKLVERHIIKGRQPIRVYLQGGLGNQLFQLAAGLDAANRLQVGLLLDCSRLGNPNTALRKYALDPYTLPEHVQVIRNPSGWKALFHKRSVNKMKNVLSRKHFVENDMGFDEAFNSVKPGFTLDGYFQSVRYFESIKAQVISVIDSCSLTQVERELVDNLSLVPFTAIHVRRGDYTNPHVASVHGLAGPKYFSEALAQLETASKLGRKLYFSDSPDMVREEFGLAFGDFAPNNLSEAATLHLMSRATSVIASNSTFSWWAGLVAEHANNGIVIVPKPWFADRTPADLVPQNWRQISRN